MCNNNNNNNNNSCGFGLDGLQLVVSKGFNLLMDWFVCSLKGVIDQCIVFFAFAVHSGERPRGGGAKDGPKKTDSTEEERRRKHRQGEQ